MRPQVVLFDVGGVLATNGWDRAARERAADHFGYDPEEFQDRHDFVAHDFETGRLTISEYLERTLFYRKRDFTEEDVVAFMKAQTAPKPDSLAVLAELGGHDGVLVGTLNNESRELNEHRIRVLGLKDHVPLFLSSCYLGVRKPEPEIYRMATEITGHDAAECLFIDDRSINIECAEFEGMATHLFTGAAALREALVAHELLPA